MRHGWQCLGVLLVLSLCACLASPERAAPHRLLRPPLKPSSETLIIMLPGMGDRASSFGQHGFIDALRLQGIKADVELAELGAGFLSVGRALNHLHVQIVLPARQRGYRHIWLLGVSLGAMISMQYAVRHADLLSGMVLIAPFTGRRGFVASMRGHQGQPTLPPKSLPSLQMDTDALQAWIWMCSQPWPGKPPVYLAYGANDSMARDIDLLASCVQGAQVYRDTGTHAWPSWRQQWAALLAGPLGNALRDGADAWRQGVADVPEGR